MLAHRALLLTYPKEFASQQGRERNGETTADENRGDQWDEHHGEPDDIV